MYEKNSEIGEYHAYHFSEIIKISGISLILIQGCRSIISYSNVIA